MGTDVTVRLRAGEPLATTFEGEEDWQVKATDGLVFVLGPDGVIRLVVNQTDFICAVAVTGGEDGS